MTANKESNGENKGGKDRVGCPNDSVVTVLDTNQATFVIPCHFLQMEGLIKVAAKWFTDENGGRRFEKNNSNLPGTCGSGRKVA